jgi:hypothetical protein
MEREIDMEPKSLFTEEDVKRMEQLPEAEQQAFMRRFAQASMAMRLADDVWESTRDKISVELDILIKDIKNRLAAEK